MKVAFGISVSPSGPLLHRDESGRFMDLVKMAEGYGAEALGTDEGPRMLHLGGRIGDGSRPVQKNLHRRAG